MTTRLAWRTFVRGTALGLLVTVATATAQFGGEGLGGGLFGSSGEGSAAGMSMAGGGGMGGMGYPGMGMGGGYDPFGAGGASSPGVPVLGLPTPTRTAIYAGLSDEQQRFQETLARMGQPSKVGLEETHLLEAVDAIQAETGVEFQIDRRALESAGQAEATLWLRPTSLPLGQALELALRERDLTWVPHPGYVWITSVDAVEAAGKLTRIYPVADLVTYRMEDGSLRRQPAELIDAVTSQVSPETWDQVGGTSSIRTLDGGASLTVTAPWEAHRKLEHLLAAARAARGEVSQVLAETDGPGKRQPAPSAPGPEGASPPEGAPAESE